MEYVSNGRQFMPWSEWELYAKLDGLTGDQLFEKKQNEWKKFKSYEDMTNPTPYLNDNQLKGMALASYILKPENKDVLLNLLESEQMDQDSLADAILAHSFNVSNDYRVYNFNLANRAKDFLISLQDEQTSNNRPDESGTTGQA